MNESRIIEIESKLAYQEDLLQELNQLLYRQQLRINELHKTSDELKHRIGELMVKAPNQATAEVPPHY